MPLVRERRVAVPERLHVGFTPYGTCFKSHEPVNNQATNFLKFLVRKITTEYLTPHQTVLLIGNQHGELHRLFSYESLAQWSGLGKFFQWPLAQAARSSEVTVKFMGRAYPMWHEDENAWYAMVQRAEKLRGERPHTSYVTVDGEEFTVPEGMTIAEFAGGIIAGRMGAVLGAR